MKIYTAHGPITITYVLNLFLEALIKNDQPSNAYTIFESHFEVQIDERFIADGQTFAIIAKSKVHQGKTTEAFELFEKISVWSEDTVNDFFNCLLESFTKTWQIDLALTLLEKVSKNFKATTLTFNSLIDCLIKQEQTEKAWQMLDEMSERKITADSFTISTLLKGIN